jgi:hypothetical protein
MKICPGCFDNNPVTATFCKHCGISLSVESAPAVRTCPAAGHVMDPSWTVCQYCKAEGTVIEDQPARVETVVEPAPSPRRTIVEFDLRPAPVRTDGPARPVPPPPPAPAARPVKTRLNDGSASQTGLPRGSAAAAPSERRIVGILVTYSWKPDGQIFPVREGRNWIGRDPQQADIAVPEDDTLSAVNSHITFRKNFVIGDNVSMSGTDVNGEPVEQQFHPLSNYARIRTGSTLWTFIAVEPAAG